VKNLGGSKVRFFAALRMTNTSRLTALWYKMIFASSLKDSRFAGKLPFVVQVGITGPTFPTR
jgi:hypothetical protein